MKINSIPQKSYLTIAFLFQVFLSFGQNSSNFIGSGSFELRIGDNFYYASPYLYIPDNSNPISIREKSDFNISFDRHSKDHTLTNIKLGFSPISNFYGTASLMLAKNKHLYGWYNEEMISGDFGIGAYHLKKLKTRDRKRRLFKEDSRWTMENEILVNALLGFSRGKISHEKVNGIGLGEFNLNKFYGQVGFDIRSKIIGFSTNLKFGVLNYQKVYIEGQAADDLILQMELLLSQNNFMFLESTARIYTGARFGQIYISGVHSKVNAALSDFVIPNYLSVGAVLDIQDIFIKRKATMANDDMN